MPIEAHAQEVLDDAHAFWLRAPGRGEIRRVALPEPGREDVVVRTVRSGISRGTETLVFRGGVPPSQHARMRAPFQEGDFPGPVKYGYLNVGAVWDAAPLVGDRVAVVGAGMLGCCVARLLHRYPAVRVTLVDVDPARAGI